MLANYREIVSRAHVKTTSSVFEFPIGNHSGFSPNQVFFSCRSTDVKIYAIVQHLAFHGRKATPKIIRAKCGLKERTVNNGLTRLKHGGFLKKGETEWLFFHQPRQQFVSAQELATDNYGYYLRVHEMADPLLAPEELLGLSVMHNLISSNPEMDIPYIAKIFRKSENQTRIILKALAAKGYILRTRDHIRSPYRYQIVPAYLRKRLNTQGSTNMENLSTGKTNPPQNRLSNPPHYEGTISSISISKYNPDSSNTHQQPSVALLRDPFLKKELGEVIIPYTEKLARSLPHHSERIEKALKEKSAQHTQALDNSRKELRETKRLSPETMKGIERLQVESGSLEVEKKSIDHGLNVWLRYTTDENAALNERLIPLSQQEVTELKDLVRCISPKLSTESASRLAFCMLLNSLVKDLQEVYPQQYKHLSSKVKNDQKTAKAKQNTLAICVRAIKKPGYELNVAVYPKSKKRMKKEADNTVQNVAE